MIATPIRHTIDVPRPSAHPSGITEQWAESSALGRASVAHHRARPARRYLRLAPPSRPARRHRHQRCIALLRDRRTRRSRRIDTLAQAQPCVHLRESIRVTRIQNEKAQSSADDSAPPAQLLNKRSGPSRVPSYLPQSPAPKRTMPRHRRVNRFRIALWSDPLARKRPSVEVGMSRHACLRTRFALPSL
jgi:hypothetical protein